MRNRVRLISLGYKGFPFIYKARESLSNNALTTIVLAETQVKKRTNLHGENRTNAGGQLWQK